MLRINIENNGGTATLHCSGRLVFGLEVETLRSILKARPERRLEIDLKSVEAIDACGLGLLVELQHWASQEGRSLTFTRASNFVLHLIVLTGLHKVLSVPARTIRNYQVYGQNAACAVLSA